ncbi:hypothetical protein CTI12_AA525280 [Artemisia annua]|uniref:Uncharacterized protein n=1 Tax=Artemisia annua TaxID=35608 RepID=A0A2U1L7G2_ARTAN|nr:hypothetical protein CTI12_AA525280 [Artemisia annua]
MSSAPDFQTNNNTSIVNDGYDAQLAPSPEIEGRKNTSELGFADNWYEVKAAPDREGVVHHNQSVVNEKSTNTTSDKSAPGCTDIRQNNPSEVDEKSTNTTSDKSAPEYTGIRPKNPSVNTQDAVGRTIRHVNLTEYYVKKN